MNKSNLKRWKVVVFYKQKFEHDTFFIEELSELHDLIEGLIDFRLIADINIQYQL